MKLLRAQTHGGTCPGGWFLGNYSLGLERSVVNVKGPYLGRWILYVGGFTIRLHKFYRGDDARAPHDHPWTFFTFPLCLGYAEYVPYGARNELRWQWVSGWRWHKRVSAYRHIVLDPPKPFYTIVVTLRKDRSWGFWPRWNKFVPWRKWK